MIVNKEMNEQERSTERGDLTRFPLLPLRDIVIFPYMVLPFFVGRDKSIAALDAVMDGDKKIFMATQKDAQTEDPDTEDIFREGTVCQIVQMLKLPDGTVKVLVEGKQRGNIVHLYKNTTYVAVDVEVIDEITSLTPETEALVRGVTETFDNYIKLAKQIPAEILTTILNISEPSKLADSLVVHLNMKIEDKQSLLSLPDSIKRLENILLFMESEIEILQIEKKIKARVKKQMERSQKEYYLNEQMRAIQTELGGKDEFKQELRDLDEKIEQQNFTPEARQKALAELKKLKSMSPLSAEAAVVRNYLDWLVSLPWGKINAENHDVAEAEGVLNAEHYGLKKVKERVLEYLAVISLVNKIKGPILCLVGPPGVGKTSLARSIAGATGRAFVKMSLGGVRDEAEIRGHRRTYIGAMPGKIIQNLKKAKCNNPLFLLDEIDKMSSDFRGDPASALLEVLDPEQNSIFHDHFLDVDYDLSAVMFITTANSLHTIPRPLLDRLEIIRLEGYSEHEKLNIAKRFLVAKQIDSHGLNDRKVAFTDHALLDIIRFYTRESGVRNLERCIAAICRKIAVIFIKNKKKRFLVHAKHLEGFLGRRKYQDRPLESADSVGVAIGLAWTESGGDLLGIEVAIVPGKGKLTITGKLGDVMQESAHAAMTYVRSRSQLLGLERNFYQNIDTHIHVPEGAIPKDGPSAGITMATALISALTKIPVRRDLAMTGEITLRGVILPIGGLKEKLMAAKRSGMHLVLVPAENEKDLAELDPEITGNLIINTVSHMDEVLSHALVENVELSAPRSILKNQDLIVDNAAIAH